MSELDAIAARGVRALFGRQFGVQLLTLAAGVVLARILQPSEFGLFFIAAFLVKAIAAFGDFGFAPSLIQRHEDVEHDDLRAAFTLQLAATGTLVVVLVAAAPWLAGLYPHAPAKTTWLVRALALNFFLTSWRSVAFLQLERSLRFGRVALIEVIEALSFQSTAVVAALLGAGVWSLVAATAASGIAGTGLAFASAPWRVGLTIDLARFRALLRFAVPYQAQMILNSGGEWVSFVALGGLFGSRGVGLISWASANGRKPLAYFDNISRVAFPHLSRQQHDPTAVTRTITRYLGYVLAPAAAWSVVVAVSAHGLVPLIYTSKWTPAVPALAVFSVAVAFDAACILFVVALNSTGRPGYVARVVLVRSLLVAALAIGLGWWLGLVGFAAAHLAASIFTALVLARRVASVRAIARPLAWLVPPIVASAAVGVVARLALPDPAGSLVACVAAVVIYAAVGWRFAPASIRHELGAVLGRFRRVRPRMVVPADTVVEPL